MKRLLWIMMIFAGAFGFSLWVHQGAYAAAGLTINPFNQSLVVPADATTHPFELQVINNTAYAQVLDVKAVDLAGLDETGGLLFSGASGASISSKYQLASYLRLDTSTVTLTPGQSQTVRGSVVNIDSLSPGTHYAALLISKPASTAKGSTVPLQSIIASTLLVRRMGGERYGLVLDRVDHSADWAHQLDLLLHFRNTGNIGLVPRGVVRLLDPFGREIARTAINDQSGIILPEASRKYPTKPKFSQSVTWPGRYTLSIDYRYDGNDTFSHYRATFYYVDARLAVAGVLGFMVLLVGGIGVVKRRRKAPRK